MFCTNCGFALEEGYLYCGKCGCRTVDAPGISFARPLRRVAEEKKVAGVCAGFARYLSVDVTLVRVLWVGASILPFAPGLIAYTVCWMLMPRDDHQVVGSAVQQSS